MMNALRRLNPGGYRMKHLAVVSLYCLLVVGCNGDPEAIDDRCMASMLPLTGLAAGPTVTDVGLEVQLSGIVVVATASDPQGSANLDDVVQSIGVFPDAECTGEAIVIQDDLVGSGVEETFGTVVDAAADPQLYGDISNAQRWPVEVDFRDQDANRTSGRIMARIIR
jgi:hypothetical protein